MVRKNKKQSKKSLLLITSGLVVLCLVGGGVVWAISRHNDSSNTSSSVSTAQTASSQKKSTVNLSPPTQQDQAYNDSTKASIAQQNSSPTTSTQTATPVIDFAGYDNSSTIEVDSHVAGIVENGGTCTLTATLGSQTVTKTVTAVQNATDTSCPAFILSADQFSTSGNWNIQVSYSSSAYNGTSKAQTLKVQ